MTPETSRLDIPRLGMADLQLHTARSDGTASPEAIVRYAEERTELDLIAITDHDDFRGAAEACEIAARLGTRVQIIPGIEITTRAGHLLGLFLREPVPSFRSLEATLEAIARQDGLAVVPHPLSLLTASLGERSIGRVLRKNPAALAGIELANPTPAARLRQPRARRLNRARWHLAETGGSDAHFVEYIGSAVTRFPGRTPDDLRAALLAATTVAETRPTPALRTIGARRLLAQQVRGLSATPRATVVEPLRLRWRKWSQRWSGAGVR